MNLILNVYHRLKLPVLITILCFLSAIFSQIGQYIASREDVLKHAIATWNEKYPEHVALSDLFVAECLSPQAPEKLEKELLSKDVVVTSFYDCGDNLGANELMVWLKGSDDALSTLAWPLSMVND